MGKLTHIIKGVGPVVIGVGIVILFYSTPFKSWMENFHDYLFRYNDIYSETVYWAGIRHLHPTYGDYNDTLSLEERSGIEKDLDVILNKDKIPVVILKRYNEMYRKLAEYRSS